jgi:hypothetical protein
LRITRTQPDHGELSQFCHTDHQERVGELTMRLLLLLPFVGLLWVPFYNGLTPELFGFPFFYWYQLMWVPITSLLLWIVYRGKRT